MHALTFGMRGGQEYRIRMRQLFYGRRCQPPLPAVPSNVSQVALVLDLARAPQWLFAKYPDARSKDSHGRSYELLSWSHEEANKAALGFLGDIAGHLAQTHRGCVTAMQPVYNNEYQVGTARVNRVARTRASCMLHARGQVPCRMTASRRALPGARGGTV